MRGRHPKAPSAGSIANRSTRRPKLLLPLAAVLLVSLALGVSLATATAPTVTIEAASELSYNSAKVLGHVDPADHETSSHFEYVDQARFEASEWAEASTAGFSSLPEGAGPTEVTETLSGLMPGTTYHLRLVAENADGTDTAIAPTFATDPVNPPAVAIDPITSFTATTAHFTATVNSGGPGAGEKAGIYEFSCSSACPGAEGSHEFEAEGLGDGITHTIEADAENLEPNTNYTVSLLARNAQTGAEGQDKSGSTSFTTEAAPPTALTGVNVPRPDGSLLVIGYVNPRNSEITDCHFEYGLDQSYGQSALCQAPPPSGGQAREVSVELNLKDLTPGTLYHFRVVATNVAGTTESEDGVFGTEAPAGPPGECPNEALRLERHQTYLPDCRAYEMVSHPDKNGAQITLGLGAMRASSKGGASIFASNVASADAKGTGIFGDVIFRGDRGPNGWVTRAILPAQAPNSRALFTSALFDWFTPDLSHGLLRANDPPLVPGASEGIPNLYLTTGTGESPQLISPTVNKPFSIETYSPISVDASDDLTRVVFESTQNLTADAPPQDPLICGSFGFCAARLYEWHAGTLSTVGILPDGTPAPAGAVAGPPGGVSVGLEGDNAVSADGNRIYFTTPTVGPGQLYLRKSGSATIHVNQSEKSTPAPEPAAARFLTASADGHRALFVTSEPLLDADKNDTDDLYVYEDSESPSTDQNLTLISEDNESTDGYSAAVAGVLGTSENAQHVYFAAEGRLVSAAPRGSAAYLYEWDKGDLRFVASLGNPIMEQANWSQIAIERESRVSSDGKVVVFNTSARQPGSEDSEELTQLYRYDAMTRRLVCMSCGVDPAPAALNFPGETAITQSPTYESRNLVDDGERVFFNTSAALVARDTNGKVDVYEWHNGVVGLISSGFSASDSYFADASANGEDVLFLTRDQLVGWDSDLGRDLYVARRAGGFKEPPPAAPDCLAEECQGELSRSPGTVQPSSVHHLGSASERQRMKKARRERICRRQPKRRRDVCKRPSATANHGRGVRAR